MNLGGGGERRIWTIYCEGFHDRDFLAGLFEDALDFTALRGVPGIDRGVFAFRHRDTELWLRQCGSKSNVVPAFAAALREATARRPAGLVMCLDERDGDVAPTAADALGSARDRLHAMVATAIEDDSSLTDSSFEPVTGVLRLKDGHEVHLASVTWCCDDAAGTNLPQRQNLERLITAACCGAYPERGAIVRAWLDARTEPPTDAPSRDKAYSWSHMAGWYPSPGGSDFFRAVWRDARTRSALCHRMATTGIDALLDGMAVVPPWRSAAAST